ncbi:MAG TPA: HD-GYP domain-containing protein [Rhodocyclaceae bacterium]|nr:HD-GYP domain-containing protein [Rhodocyclaceae bacterium]
MNNFRKQTAWRIGIVSLLLAAAAGPLAWYVAREGAEETAVAHAVEESSRLLSHNRILGHDAESLQRGAEAGAQLLVGGLFDIVEIYDASGTKIAEAATEAGEAADAELPSHDLPTGETQYESLSLKNGGLVWRVTVKLHQPDGKTQGYFEGERIVPDWQRNQILSDAGITALMVVLASFICGAAIYPVVTRLSRENEQKARQILEANLAMMEALGQAVAKRDSDTGAHNYRVAWVSAQLGEKAGLEKPIMQTLITGSFLHDVGKIGIPDGILLKPGRLTDEEMDIMRRHVVLGEEILSGARWLEGARCVVSGHHEKWDGSGYPRRVVGKDIPIQARIFAIADVFDALCSERPYKRPMTPDAALAEMRKGRGSHFDPYLFDLFEAMALDIHSAIGSASEDEARLHMERVVHRYFGI